MIEIYAWLGLFFLMFLYFKIDSIKREYYVHIVIRKILFPFFKWSNKKVNTDYIRHSKISHEKIYQEEYVYIDLVKFKNSSMASHNIKETSPPPETIVTTVYIPKKMADYIQNTFY